MGALGAARNQAWAAARAGGWALGFAVTTVAASGDGTEPVTEPSGLAAVRQVVIDENAARAHSAAEGVDCSKFVLTERLVVRYFSRARRIREHDFNHLISWLPCYAGGSVSFADGRRARWSIREDGGAWLHFEGGAELHLYCPRCRLPRTGSWMQG